VPGENQWIRTLSHIARSLAYDLSIEIAPEELDLFDEYADVDPNKHLRIHDDEPLAFGISEIVIIMTPILVSLAKAALEYLAVKAPEFGYDLASDILRERINNWANPKRAQLPNPTFSIMREGLTHVVEAEALRLGLDNDTSSKLAAATCQRLGFQVD